MLCLRTCPYGQEIRDVALKSLSKPANLGKWSSYPSLREAHRATPSKLRCPLELFGLLRPLTLAKAHAGATAVLVDEFDADAFEGPPIPTAWARFAYKRKRASNNAIPIIRFLIIIFGSDLALT